MSAKDSNTEELIKETAKSIFFTEGRFNATTQEIADAASVNRTLVHYYFRSRDILFQKVLVEGREEFRKKMIERIDPAIPLKEKVSRLIDVWMSHSLKYPYLDTYLASQMHNSDTLEEIFSRSKEENLLMKTFCEEVLVEMKAGRLIPMDPIHFLLNLIALVSYPLSMRPLLEKSLALNKKDYNKLMADRKSVVLKTLFIK